MNHASLPTFKINGVVRHKMPLPLHEGSGPIHTSRRVATMPEVIPWAHLGFWAVHSTGQAGVSPTKAPTFWSERYVLGKRVVCLSPAAARTVKRAITRPTFASLFMKDTL